MHLENSLHFYANGNQLGDQIAMEGKLGVVFCDYFFGPDSDEGVAWLGLTRL